MTKEDKTLFLAAGLTVFIQLLYTFWILNQPNVMGSKLGNVSPLPPPLTYCLISQLFIVGTIVYFWFKSTTKDLVCYLVTLVSFFGIAAAISLYIEHLYPKTWEPFCSIENMWLFGYEALLFCFLSDLVLFSFVSLIIPKNIKK